MESSHGVEPRVFLSGHTKRSDIISEHDIHLFSKTQQLEAGYNDSLNNNLSTYMHQLTQASSAMLGQNQYYYHICEQNTVQIQYKQLTLIIPQIMHLVQRCAGTLLSNQNYDLEKKNPTWKGLSMIFFECDYLAIMQDTLATNISSENVKIFFFFVAKCKPYYCPAIY